MACNLKAKYKRLIGLAELASLAEDLEEDEREERKGKDRIWVRDWIAKRPTEVPLFVEITTQDHEKFFEDFRLYPEDFEQLLAR
jgi:hypothetical protein